MLFNTDLMIFIPYVPRADAAARGYHQWLRDVDAPFFNSVPGILHYSNWEVKNPPAGHYTHCSFMYLDPALGEGVWTNPDVVAFAAGWTEKWGIDPGADDMAVNYHSYQLRLKSGQAAFDPSAVRIAASASSVPRFGGAIWEVTASVVGASPTPFHDFAFGATAGTAQSDDILDCTLIDYPT